LGVDYRFIRQATGLKQPIPQTQIE
jgi:hypothetical protein